MIAILCLQSYSQQHDYSRIWCNYIMITIQYNTCIYRPIVEWTIQTQKRRKENSRQCTACKMIARWAHSAFSIQCSWGQAQTPTQSSIGNEKNTMCYMSRVGFHFNIIYCPITCSIPNLIFSLFPLMTAKTCSGGLVLFGCGIKNGTVANWCTSACWSLFVFPKSPIYI